MAGAELHTPLARLDALLAVTRLVRAGTPRDELLRAVADAIAESLGFRTVVVNVRRPAWDDLVVAEVHGSSEAVAALLGTTSAWADWELLLDERFARSGASFVPAGSLDWSTRAAPTFVPTIEHDGEEDGWQADDAVFAPLWGPVGELHGVISVDEPTSGRRPDDGDLALLAAFCAHLGTAIEFADAAAAATARAAALEELARASVTVLSSLDLDAALDRFCAAIAQRLCFSEVEIALVRDGRLLTHGVIGPDRHLDGMALSALDDDLSTGVLIDGLHQTTGQRTTRDTRLLRRLKHPDGRLLGVLSTRTPGESPLPWGERRRLLRAFSNQVEATLSSAAHAAVVQFQAHKTAILEASVDAIFTMDADGRLLEFNGAATRIFGHRSEDILGRDLVDLIFPAALREALRSRLWAQFDSASGAPDGERIETRAARASGEEFPCEVAAARIEVGGQPPRLTAFLRDISDRVADRAALERQRDEALYAASHDRLTGLPNRQAAIEELAARISQLRVPYGDAVVCVSIALDDFDRITDSFGLATSDELVRAAGRRLIERRPPGSRVVHLGGTEFAVLAGPLRADGAPAVAQRVAGSLKEVFGLEGLEIHLDATIGYDVALRGDDAPDDMIRRAGVARHRARGSGNRIERYDESLDDSREQLTMLAQLRCAIERGELELHYQPLFSVPDRRCIGIEALLRWRRDGSLVAPGAFIGLAETSGLIVPIGEWVIDEACRQARQWLDEGKTVPVIGVNVSAHQLPRTDLPAVIAAALERHDIPGEHLVVEVTESAIETTAGAMEAALNGVDALGVRSALDDFGAGHSSLTRVATLPVKMVKLDRGFLRAVPRSPRATEMLRAIVGGAKALGFLTVVEGVETQEQWDVVAEMGADFVQGFLLARPEPPASVARWLTS